MQQTYSNIQPEQIIIRDELFFRIADSGNMRPFFMSIVSNADHWLFTSSNGGVAAGRKNADHAFFPYYTEDKIADNAEYTGSKTIVRIQQGDKQVIWEPFSIRSEGHFRITRNIYKNKLSNKIIFEEVNHDCSLCFRYEWNLSDRFGFIKRSSLVNLADVVVEMVIADGLQNILPYGVECDLQTKVSNLADAYKRAELHSATGIAIFALSAIIVDKAEPSEALKANIAWSAGLEDPVYLLSNRQLQLFRNGETLVTETDCKAEKGAFFTVSNINLAPNEVKEWITVAEVALDQPAVIALAALLKERDKLLSAIDEDVKRGSTQLLQMISAADGIQSTGDALQDTRHLSNVLFNTMRGGIFDKNYQIDKKDLMVYLQATAKVLFENNTGLLNDLPETFSLFELNEFANATGNAGLIRLTRTYLPLKFSRRHGDPSRPWNKFSIELKNESDGSKILNYEGNWRDIFQNWEALAHAYPYFIEGMITKFLNASTFDGYNPYRISKNGFDWEVIEADNPWSYIGYWGDHQLIYLLKFLEFAQQRFPAFIEQRFQDNYYVYANVPYKIKPYASILKDPKNTIEFDHTADRAIRERMEQWGTDGALLTGADGAIYYVGFAEKILAVVLAKLSNFIPGAGIWMNTQRPEWNDANNALVGNGVSVVTLCYLRRFLQFFLPMLENRKEDSFRVSAELYQCFTRLQQVLEANKELLRIQTEDKWRKQIADGLGIAGSEYRETIYHQGFSGKKEQLPAGRILDLFRLALQYAEHSIAENKRPDHLFHAYNTIRISENGMTITRLSEMLEGQVAVLSSGYLDPQSSLLLLDAMQNSALWRADQQSYMLYPDKALPGFLEKNNVPVSAVERSPLLMQLLHDNNTAILKRDILGGYHFNSNFRNAGDLVEGLAVLPAAYQSLAEAEHEMILEMYERVFNHQSFTGRSGTFYGYEGLGCIYWHMVSKLLLAVQETCMHAAEVQVNEDILNRLLHHYYTIRAGIGVHKPPSLYGAFPTDPYSHTPKGKGAQQPGMTGQVKEDILCRVGELGITAKNGRTGFKPTMLRAAELSETAAEVVCYDADGNEKKLQVPGRSLLFTCCTVPVIYTAGERNEITVERANGTIESIAGNWLSETDSEAMWKRNGMIRQVSVVIKATGFLNQ